MKPRELSPGKFTGEFGIIKGRYFWDGNCLGGIVQGGYCPGWELIGDGLIEIEEKGRSLTRCITVWLNSDATKIRRVLVPIRRGCIYLRKKSVILIVFQKISKFLNRDNSWCLKSLFCTPDFENLRFLRQYCNWGRSYNVLYVLCVITFLPYRQLDDWLQSRSQDIILQYFNFYGWAFSRSPGILLTSSVITLENIVRVGLTVQELHPIEKV